MTPHAPPDSSKMRPMHYVSELYPALPETFTRADVQALAREGVPITVWSLHPRRPIDPAINAADPPVRYSPGPFTLAVAASVVRCTARRPLLMARLLGTVLFGGTTPFHLGRSLRGPVHLAWGCWLSEQVGKGEHFQAQFMGGAASVAWAASRLTGGSYSFTAHSEWGIPFVRAKMRDADVVIAISEHERSRLLSFVPSTPPGKVLLNRLGVRLDEWIPSRAEKLAHHPLRILAVSTLGPTKGNDVLIRAAGILDRRGVEFLVNIVGEGPERPLLETLIRQHGVEQRVTLLGARQHADVRKLLEESDVGVLACKHSIEGRHDGIPIALMESMAAGKATVSTKLAGIPELIEDGVSGLLAEPDDAEGLADILQRLAEDAALRERLGRAGRIRMEEGFDAEASAPRFVEIVRALLMSPPRQGTVATRDR